MNAVANRSILYGKKIAQLIFEWSKTDGGHRGYLSNFDKKLVFRNKNPEAGNRHYMHNHSAIFHCIRIGEKTGLSWLLIQPLPAPVFIPFDTVPGFCLLQSVYPGI